MPMMKITLWEEDDEVEHEVPARWEICGTCQGDGGHSLRLGAISAEEWGGWDYEDRESYLRGEYDEICEDCDGSGKVLVPENPEGEIERQWIDQENDRLTQEAEDRRTLYWESGGTMGSRTGSRW